MLATFLADSAYICSRLLDTDIWLIVKDVLQHPCLL